MTVEILSISARGEWDVAVTFQLQSGGHSQRETFVIPASAVADLRLRVGPTETDCYDAVSESAERGVALKRGLYLLGYGSCSERALIRKLTDKGIAKETAAWAAKELAARGYLNEEADALREAEKCLAKLWGQRRIVTTLMTKGFSQKAIKQALYALEDQEVDFAALCAERIRQKEGAIPRDPDERRRLMASLQRNGFSASEIREAFRLVGRA